VIIFKITDIISLHQRTHGIELENKQEKQSQPRGGRGGLCDQKQRQERREGLQMGSMGEGGPGLGPAEEGHLSEWGGASSSSGDLEVVTEFGPSWSQGPLPS
jgi:hypothetical protein